MATSVQKPEIYFHCGLAKTGTKYLQHKFYPKLQGLYYIQKTNYKKAPKIVRQTRQPKYLISQEYDRQLSWESEWFASEFPQAKVIVVLRRHDSWVASQYRRMVKNGQSMTLTEFIDIENNTGRWDRSELNFYDKLQTLERNFGRPPLVLFYEDFKKDPEAFLDKIAEYTGATYDKNAISLSPKHRSYNEKQLKVMRRLGKHLIKQSRTLSKNPLKKFWQEKGRLLGCYSILYSALLLPDSWVESEDLTPQNELDKIREACAEDWEKCQQYARENNPM